MNQPFGSEDVANGKSDYQNAISSNISLFFHANPICLVSASTKHIG